MKKMMFKVMATVGVLATLAVTPVFAAENAVPAYEVKFLLDDAKVLNEEHKLSELYCTDFKIDGYTTNLIQYLETADRSFDNEGWINRIRYKEDKSKHDITFKKRYSVPNDDIEVALTKANEDGFNADDKEFEAEIDWSYDKMTLSFSTKEKLKGYSAFELPDQTESSNYLKLYMPAVEKVAMAQPTGSNVIVAGRANTLVNDTVVCGPVQATVYEGEVAGLEVGIEVWPVYVKETGITEYVTEISFDADTFEEAAENRAKLQNALEEKGILVHGGSLKTQKVLSAYLD